MIVSRRSESRRKEACVDETDLKHLRRAIDLARISREHGNHRLRDRDAKDRTGAAE